MGDPTTSSTRSDRAKRPAGGIGRWSLAALDCPEPRALAEFYLAITGWELDHDGGDWVQLRSDAGATLAGASFSGTGCLWMDKPSYCKRLTCCSDLPGGISIHLISRQALLIAARAS
jgi:hypothetical protein